MIKVSMIVPIHNSEAYLDQCVQSCLNQTLREIEIILIDDASSDCSAKKIAEYALKEPNLIRAIYLKENIRQGGARNQGLAIAQGEYVAFVDSDDWVEPGFCEQLYQAAKKSNANMAGEEQFFLENKGRSEVQRLRYCSSQLKEKKQLYNYMSGCGYFWNRIYLRTWLLQNELYFPEKLAFEDSYFNTLTALYAECVETVNGAFYHYFQSEDSTVRTRNKPHLYDKIDIADRIWKDCKERGIYNRYPDEIDKKCISILANTLFYICLGSFDQIEYGQMDRIRNVLKEHKKDYRKNPYYKELPRTQRWFLNLNMISPQLAKICYQGGLHRWIELMEVAAKKLQKRKWKE